MDSMPRITRVILYANSRYNYLTVNDNGKAKLHYVKPVKVKGKWVHLGKTYGESLVMKLDGVYNPIDSDKIMTRYELYDYYYGSIWVDTSNGLLCIVKESEVEYDVYDGFKAIYPSRIGNEYFSIEYMNHYLEKYPDDEKIINGSCWVDEFGTPYHILKVSYISKRIHTVTLYCYGDRKTIGIETLLRDFTFSYASDIEVNGMETSYCCKDCVVVGDIYIFGNEAHRVTGIGESQSVSLYNGFTNEKTVVSYMDFKRRYNKFDVGSIKIGDKFVSVYGGSDVFHVKQIDLTDMSFLIEREKKSKTTNAVSHNLLTLLSRYKPV